MRKMWLVLVVGGLALGMTLPGSAAPAGTVHGASGNSGLASLAPSARSIVAFTQLPDDAIARLQRVGITHAALFESADSAAVIGPASAMRAISRWPDVVSVAPEQRFELTLHHSKEAIGVDGVRSGAPPLSSAYTGKGVVVAVVDSGIAAHRDLAGRVAVNVNLAQAALLDPITDGEYSRSHEGMPVGVDELNHGTSVAGIVAGSGEAARGPDDLSGIAPEAILANLDVYGPEAWGGVTANPLLEPLGNLWEVNLLAAYQWLLDHQHDPRFPGGIRVVNNSWGGTHGPEDPFPVAMTRMIEAALDAGMVIVFAAGNTGPEPNTVTFPGSLPSVITVGSICTPEVPNDGFYCEPGVVSSISGRGPTVDIVAPGVDIWSASGIPGFGFVPLSPDPTYPPVPGDDPVSEANNRLHYWGLASGTSFSAPHVSGIVALMLEANPALTHEEVQVILRETASDLGPAGFDEDYGYGLIDALRAVAAAENGL